MTTILGSSTNLTNNSQKNKDTSAFYVIESPNMISISPYSSTTVDITSDVSNMCNEYSTVHFAPLILEEVFDENLNKPFESKELPLISVTGKPRE